MFVFYLFLSFFLNKILLFNDFDNNLNLFCIKITPDNNVSYTQGGGIWTKLTFKKFVKYRYDYFK